MFVLVYICYTIAGKATPCNTYLIGYCH